MGKRILVLPALLAFLFIFIRSVYAATITISAIPSKITDEPFSINVQISGAAANTTNYLRIDLYQNGTQSYFGYTYNSTDFYNGSDYQQYSQISIGSDGSATKTLEGRVDVGSSAYKGTGAYTLRVRRYTGSGSYSAGDANAGAVSVNIEIASPSPDPTPTPSPSPAPSPSPIPLKSPSPTPSPAVPTPSPKVSPSPDSADLPGDVLAESSQSAGPAPNASSSTQNTTGDGPKIAIILIGLGLILIGLASAFYLWYSKKNEKIG